MKYKPGINIVHWMRCTRMMITTI